MNTEADPESLEQAHRGMRKEQTGLCIPCELPLSWRDIWKPNKMVENEANKRFQSWGHTHFVNNSDTY